VHRFHVSTHLSSLFSHNLTLDANSSPTRACDGLYNPHRWYKKAPPSILINISRKEARPTKKSMHFQELHIPSTYAAVARSKASGLYAMLSSSGLVSLMVIINSGFAKGFAASGSLSAGRDR
jgi:hypothetical protein